MQHVNDDMEELFRRAAEGYSLNTNSGDFNEVLKKLEAEKNIQPEGKTVASIKKQWFLLLLLIPFAWVCNNYLINEKQDPPVTKMDYTNNPPASTGNNNVINSPTRENTKTSQSLHKSFVNPTLSFIQSQQPVSIVSVTPVQKAELKEETPNTTQPSVNTTQTDPDAGNENEKLIAAINDIMQKPEVEKQENKTVVTQTSLKNKQTQNKNNKFLYAGIMVSPDISTVKFQSVKNVGIGIGLLAGYQFNKRISIESGVAWDKKFYYSNGEHANTEHIYLSTGAKLINLTGNCKMIEIPLNIKYNFKAKGNHNLSVSTGVSSYLMKNETYDYLVEHNNYQYKKTSTYKNSSKNFITVINVAAGYNLSFGKANTFRVEPYVKIPLKGAGITSIPITSTGINIGITKRIL